MKVFRYLLPILLLAAVLVVLDLALRHYSVGVPPPEFCPDGSPRSEFSYQSRNAYEQEEIEREGQYIVCFGDSWTYGLGVRFAETWPAKLEALLQEKEPETRVVNTARVLTTTADVVEMFDREITRYRSRRAVVLVGAQDAAPLALLREYPPGNPYEAKECPQPLWRLKHWLQRRTLAFRLSVEPPDPPDNKEYIPRRSTVADTQMLLFRLGQLAAEVLYT